MESAESGESSFDVALSGEGELVLDTGPSQGTVLPREKGLHSPRSDDLLGRGQGFLQGRLPKYRKREAHAIVDGVPS